MLTAFSGIIPLSYFRPSSNGAHLQAWRKAQKKPGFRAIDSNDIHLIPHSMVPPPRKHFDTLSLPVITMYTRCKMEEAQEPSSATSTTRLQFEHGNVARSERRRLCVYWTKGTLCHYARAGAGGVAPEFGHVAL